LRGLVPASFRRQSSVTLSGFEKWRLLTFRTVSDCTNARRGLYLLTHSIYRLLPAPGFTTRLLIRQSLKRFEGNHITAGYPSEIQTQNIYFLRKGYGKGHLPGGTEKTQNTSLSDSVAGIVTNYGLDGRGVGFRIQVGSRISCSLRCPDRL
jgi:hypothetical protein